MTNEFAAAGYIITDLQRTVIYGIGSTVDEAWAQVVSELGGFSDAYGNTVDPDDAYETQFCCHGATASLLETVEFSGGAIAWSYGPNKVACTLDELDEQLAD